MCWALVKEWGPAEFVNTVDTLCVSVASELKDFSNVGHGRDWSFALLLLVKVTITARGWNTVQIITYGKVQTKHLSSFMLAILKETNMENLIKTKSLSMKDYKLLSNGKWTPHGIRGAWMTSSAPQMRAWTPIYPETDKSGNTIHLLHCSGLQIYNGGIPRLEIKHED